MIALMWNVSTAIRYYVRRYMPTNILLDLIRTRPGLKWGIPAALVLVPAYLYAASLATTVIGRGGPGWLNILVLLLIWNALKLIAMVPVSLVLLVRVRLSERRARRTAEGEVAGYAPGRQLGPLTTWV